MSTIKTLVFDFGDVFINLDKAGAMKHALNIFDIDVFPDELWQINYKYEVGAITTTSFISFYNNRFPKLTEKDILFAWNYIIKDFPKYRFDWLKKIKSTYNFKLILLSNTNKLHIDLVKKQTPFYDDFKACFDAFYLSHEIHLRKPNTNVFEFVLKENNIKANECLFVDDTKENTDAAKKLGFHVWNIDENNQDVVDLFDINKPIF